MNVFLTIVPASSYLLPLSHPAFQQPQGVETIADPPFL